MWRANWNPTIMKRKIEDKKLSRKKTVGLDYKYTRNISSAPTA